MGRNARNGVRADAAGRPCEPRPGERTGEHPAVDRGDRQASSGAPAGRPGNPQPTRGGGNNRFARVRGSVHGLLQAARLPRRRVAGMRPSLIRVHRAARSRVPDDERAKRVHVTGTLKTWSVIHRLGDIRVPTLVVTGEYDEATPAINRTVSKGIPGAESVIYPNASHMAHVEDTDGYVRLLDRFFSRVEAEL